MIGIECRLLWRAFGTQRSEFLAKCREDFVCVERVTNFAQ